jgi:hypothetical protein
MQTDLIPIPAETVVAQYPAAEEFLLRALKSTLSGSATAFQYASPLPDSPSLKLSNSSSLTGRFSRSGGLVPSADEHACLYAVKRGIAIAIAIANWFGESKGLHSLLKRARIAPLGDAEAKTMQEIVKARAWILTFVTSGYVNETVAPHQPKDVIPESYVSIDAALTGLMETLDSQSATPIPSLVSAWAARVVAGQSMTAHLDLGPYFDEFAKLAIGLDDGEFTIDGMKTGRRKLANAKSAIIVKQPLEIIGNRIAKAQATKLAKMLVSYDFKEQKNPFVELGGFLFTVLGDGEPGTGKTSLIQMTCGLIKTYCDVAGYEYTFENFSIDQISDYQGRSAHNARQFVNRIIDPSMIAFGSIDDIDQIAGKRDNEQNTSIGQQEVTAVLMNAFDGVDTRIRGNCSFGLFTNFPDKVDDALRQRAAARWLIDGPQTDKDFADILDLMIGKAFTGPKGDSVPGADLAVSDPYSAHRTPSEPRLLQVFESVIEKGVDLTTLNGIALYLHAIKTMDKRFTARAIRNITNAVMARSLDVDMPDEWFSAPDVFLHKSMEMKTSMIRELQKPVTASMMLEEVNRYADGELRFANKAAESDVERRVRSMEVEQRAIEQYRTGALA